MRTTTSDLRDQALERVMGIAIDDLENARPRSWRRSSAGYTPHWTFRSDAQLAAKRVRSALEGAYDIGITIRTRTQHDGEGWVVECLASY